ncbi:MAG: hypothetical protein EPO06_11975 [Burkholderiaceae bacterium]|nr:MAG: hypothetical protein EPO06_11975 [Burkholderiaceae bacterium]
MTAGAARGNFWWCSNCREEVDPARVTFQERHDSCGHAVRWIDAKPTATIRGTDGQPLDRSEYADRLEAQAYGPADGDRVRLTYGDGSTVQGTWTTTGDGPVLHLDDETLHHVNGASQRTILARSDVGRRVALSDGEGQAIASLLDELAGVYPDEPLGELARRLAVMMYDRMGI